MKKLVVLAAPIICLLALSSVSERTGRTMALSVTAVQETILTFDSKKHTDNQLYRQNWLNAIGITKPQYVVDFEKGFSNNQNISGRRLRGGLVIKDTSGEDAVIIRSGNGTIGGSNPVGVFSATHNEQQYLELDFSANPVDYVAFQDIDQAKTKGFVEFVDGRKTPISIDTTATSGDSAEFFGIFRNNSPRIKRVQLHASGDNLWGIDNIEYGVVRP